MVYIHLDLSFCFTSLNVSQSILLCFFRASLFHGYMICEIIGKTPFVLILDEDLESVALSHEMSKYTLS